MPGALGGRVNVLRARSRVIATGRRDPKRPSRGVFRRTPVDVIARARRPLRTYPLSAGGDGVIGWVGGGGGISFGRTLWAEKERFAEIVEIKYESLSATTYEDAGY